MSRVESDELFAGVPIPIESNVRLGPRKKDTQERLKTMRQAASAAKLNLEMRVFDRLPYSRKVEYCLRPEQLTEGASPESWAEINARLGTHASSLPELVEELGKLRFGHRPKVGDSFCGAGSVPFEAARLGCDAYGSDLSPVAALLTWAALNIVGGGPEVVEQVRKAQERIYQEVDRQVSEWGIEHNELGWHADAFLYCVEVRDPESGWSFRGQVRKSCTSTAVVAEFEFPPSDLAGGIVKAVLSAEASAAIPCKEKIAENAFVYDMERYQGDPEVVRKDLPRGRLYVIPEVTRQ